MAGSKIVELLLWAVISYAVLYVDGIPFEGREKVLHAPVDVIHVLDHTTAWLNWTHTLEGTPVIEWNIIRSDGSTVKLMTFAEGRLFDRGGSDRFGYIETAGSATIYLKNVHTSDDGIYEVRIYPQSAAEAIDTSTMRLRVVPPTEIGVRVTINDIQADITVADNGTDVLLPDDRVILTPNPDVKLERLYSEPWLASSYHVGTKANNTNKLPNTIIKKCGHDREDLSEIVIAVSFDIQNLDVIRITKPVHAPASWTTTPGHIRVLAHTTASFDWTHDIERTDIEWYYGPRSTTGRPELSYIMGFTDNRLYISLEGDRHFRVQSDKLPCGADLKLHNVHKADEGWYSVKVVDVTSSSRYHISNMAEMSVIEVTDLHYNVGLGSFMHSLSVSKNGTQVKLPEVGVTLSSTFSVYLNIADSAPLPDTLTVYSKHHDDEAQSVRMECHRTRVCEGYIPGTALANYNETSVTIMIDFGVQNLGLVSLHTRALLQPETDVTYNGADTCTPHSQTRALVYMTAAAVIIMQTFMAVSCTASRQPAMSRNMRQKRIEVGSANGRHMDEGARAFIEPDYLHVCPIRNPSICSVCSDLLTDRVHTGSFCIICENVAAVKSTSKMALCVYCAPFLLLLLSLNKAKDHQTPIRH